VRWLLARAAAAPSDSAGPYPLADGQRATLEARLALLAGDSASAIRQLERSVEHVPDPYAWYYPLAALPVQRLVLARLLAARGRADQARRWIDSFARSWSVGVDLVRPLAAQLAVAPR
jgi:hypothetical protein